MRLSWLCLSGLLPFAALAEESAPKSKVEQVKVGPNQAHVTRSLQIPCKGGRAVARFGTLPTLARPESVRADAAGRAQVLAVNLERLAGEARSAVSGLERAKARVAALETELTRASGQAFGSLEAALAQGGATDELKGRLDGLRRERLEALAHRQEVVQALAEARREVELLKATPEGALGEESSVDVAVAVECREESEALVRLTYAVSGAGWRPVHQIHWSQDGDATTGTVEWVTGALIHQTTGEDWEDAWLSLTTASIWPEGRAPEAERRRLSAVELPESLPLTEGQAAVEGLLAEAPLIASPLSPDAPTLKLEASRVMTVTGDGQVAYAPLHRWATAGEVSRVALPRTRRGVHEVLRLETPSERALPEGVLQVFTESSYRGQTLLGRTRPGQPLKVSLGPVPGLEVKRVVTRDEEDSGFFSRDFEREVRLEVHNRTDQPASVTVLESIPVPAHEDVEVELLPEGTSSGSVYDATEGLVQFDARVPAQELTALKVAYTLSVPESWPKGLPKPPAPTAPAASLKPSLRQ